MPKVFSVPVSKIDIEEINNGDFLKLKLYAISDTVNRNGSEFLREGFEEQFIINLFLLTLIKVWAIQRSIILE